MNYGLMYSMHTLLPTDSYALHHQLSASSTIWAHMPCAYCIDFIPLHHIIIFDNLLFIYY
ncbi:hypothetical protein BDZ91DRAFT_721782 [Kalaharituber pfeilii]|nr:hypothetical protein BDZ91DRAFT_721782 [Kalaharituber pfeilii]